MSDKPIEMLPVVADDGSVTYVEARPELVTPPAVRRKPTGGLFDPIEPIPRELLDRAMAHINGMMDRWSASRSVRVLDETGVARLVEVCGEAPEVDFSAPGGAVESAKPDRKRLDKPTVDK